jgi:aminoglycoside phosphotransferase (APT) family kinase protein
MSALANVPHGIAQRPFHDKGNTPPAPISDKASKVATRLLRYVRKRFKNAYLQFSEFPHSIDNGWETHTYLFALETSPFLAKPLTKPLVLRIYSSPEGLPRARHETAVQKHLEDLGYPVCRILILEEDCSLFGGPFLIMERALGQTLVQFLSSHPLRIWPIAYQMASAHLRLHDLPTKGFPVRTGSFLTHQLCEIEELIRLFELPGLTPGLDWLQTHRPPEPEKASILHLDFHPYNLIRNSDGKFTVLDWPEADIGDYHADLGTTALLFDCVPVEKNCLFDEMILPVGRSLLEVGYLYEYKRRMAVDEQKLAYYKALATLRRLAGYGRWLRASPLATGCKPSSIRYLCPHHLKIVQSYFRKASGVSVRLIPS